MPDGNALAEAIAEACKNIEQRVTALIEEARRENCLFFRCRLDLNAPALPIQIRHGCACDLERCIEGRTRTHVDCVT